MQFICYPKCTTCQKARKWMDANGVAYDERHIKDNNPTSDELKAWHKQSGLPLKKFFNTSGLQYKALNLKNGSDPSGKQQNADAHQGARRQGA